MRISEKLEGEPSGMSMSLAIQEAPIPLKTYVA